MNYLLIFYKKLNKKLNLKVENLFEILYFYFEKVSKYS